MLKCQLSYSCEKELDWITAFIYFSLDSYQ
jgi:hypothetical protein